jgi:predicted enzyme related to lactoylglutathione lyase
MSETRTYPDGVPSWVDTDQPDPRAAEDFYARLFGWSFATVSHPGSPFYAFASLAGREVAGLAAAESEPATWNTYIAVQDAERAAAKVSAAGGEVLVGPVDAGEGGRTVIGRDPAGALFRLWQARRHPGAQIVNQAGAWNFSDLHTDRPDEIAFYADLFGWAVEDLGFATLVRSPGYGDHLEATVDPGIRVRQQGVVAPPGFEDAVAWVGALEPGTAPHWHVTFAIEDRDATAAVAEQLGATVLSTDDTRWTRTALVRDPQGAIFTASQFTPRT